MVGPIALVGSGEFTEAMVEIDRYALFLAERMQKEVAADYERYQFHLVVQKLQGFCAEELGAFYLDILKDRLYTTAPADPARRSTQTTLDLILRAYLKLIAPFVPFTADEAWRAGPSRWGWGQSVFLADLPAPQGWDDAKMAETWTLSANGTPILSMPRMAVLRDIVFHLTDQVVILQLFYTANPTMVANRLHGVSEQLASVAAVSWNAHQWEVR